MELSLLPPLSGATAAGTKPITLCTLYSSSPFWSGVHSLTCVLSGISTCILLLMRPNKAHCLAYLRKVSFLTKFTVNCAEYDLFEDYSRPYMTVTHFNVMFEEILEFFFDIVDCSLNVGHCMSGFSAFLRCSSLSSTSWCIWCFPGSLWLVLGKIHLKLLNTLGLGRQHFGIGNSTLKEFWISLVLASRIANLDIDLCFCDQI